MISEIKSSNIDEVIANYFNSNEIVSYQRYGSGHINETYLLKASDGVLYILQKVNTSIFKNPEGIISNIKLVSEHIMRKCEKEGRDPSRATLKIIPTINGRDMYVDTDGSYWRALNYITDTVAKDRVECIEEFRDCARAFGNFLCQLEDFDASQLCEVIKDFHNTPKRYENLMRAVAEDKCGRAAEVASEIEFCRAREAFSRTLEDAHSVGKLPLRVTHNDTKLNNILFDKYSGEAVCVIDLDTIMPGYAVNDFGDSIRFGASTAAEDEADLSKVNFDINLYRAYAEGYLEGAAGKLTDGEIELLPVGAMMMTFECGMRFLTDYLEGDTYFRTTRAGQNLDRARNQFKLLSDMEARFEEMRLI